MRKRIATVLLAAGLASTGMLVPAGAQAAPIVPPAGLANTLDRASPVQQARYVCYRVRECSRWGCGWHRRCHWRPRRYYRGGPYFGFSFGRGGHHWRHYRHHHRHHWR